MGDKLVCVNIFITSKTTIDADVKLDSMKSQNMSFIQTTK